MMSQCPSAVACMVDADSTGGKVECPFPLSYPNRVIYEEHVKVYTTRAGLYQVKSYEMDAEPYRVHRSAVTDVGVTGNSIFAVQSDGDVLESAIQVELYFIRRANLPTITQVACGFEHVLLLDTFGTVWSRGKGPAVGRGFDRNSPASTEFQRIPDLLASSIAAGKYHSAAIEADEKDFKPTVSKTNTHVRRMRENFDAMEAQSLIEEDFVRSMVRMCSDPSGTVSSEGQSIDLLKENDPLRSLKNGSRLGKRLYIWGNGDHYCLGLGSLEDKSTPVLVPGVTHVVSVVCGTAHTVVLTANYQVYIWGLYHPDTEEKCPTLVARNMSPYVVDIAAGKCITIVTAYRNNQPEVFVVAKNLSLLSRQWITKSSGSRAANRLLQNICCDHTVPQGMAIILIDSSSSQLSRRRSFFNRLCYQICILARHLVDVFNTFSARWPIAGKPGFRLSSTDLAGRSNIVKTCAFLVQSLPILIESIYRLERYLTNVARCSDIEHCDVEELIQRCSHYYEAYEMIFLALKDISAFNGFLELVKCFKNEMKAVVSDLKIHKKKDQDIADELMKLFEKGLQNFTDLVDWELLDPQLFSNSTKQKYEVLLERGRKLLDTLDEATNNAEIIKKHLSSSMKDKFFARERRIALINKIDSVTFSSNNGGQGNNVTVILTKSELIIFDGEVMYSWNLKLIWLGSTEIDNRRRIDLLLPEMNASLSGLEKNILKWKKEMLIRILEQCGIDRAVDVAIKNAFDHIEENPAGLKAVLSKISVRQIAHKFLFGQFKDCVYEGEWTDSEMHGEGKFFDERKGILFEGEFRNNVRDGFGKWKHKGSDGVVEHRQGRWTSNELNGYAQVERFRPTGENSEPQKLLFFCGYFTKGKRRGMGKLEEHCDVFGEVVYHGNWADDVRSGYGIERSGYSKVFFGRWEDDQKCGKGREISFVNGTITEKKWGQSDMEQGDGVKMGHNYRFEGRLVNGNPDGEGILTHLLPSHIVIVKGNLQMNGGGWNIREGRLSIATRSDGPDIPPETKSSGNWAALVKECKEMLVPSSTIEKFASLKEAVQWMWRERMGETFKSYRLEEQSSIHSISEMYFADLAVRDEITWDDWQRIVNFCNSINRKKTFPLTFFLKQRYEVLSYFVGINNSKVIELVREELMDLCQDTYQLLCLLFPALPTNIDEVMSVKCDHSGNGEDKRLKGYDLVYEILPEDYYTLLVAIYNASFNDIQRQYKENSQKYCEDVKFIDQCCGFPNNSKRLVDFMKKDINDFPNGSGEQVHDHIMNIVNKLRDEFSTTVVKSSKMAFDYLDKILDINKSLCRFIGKIEEEVGADEISPALSYVIWKASPDNFYLNLELIEDLSNHRENRYGPSSKALMDMKVSYNSLSR